jgi:hypothetical protein
MQPVLGEAFCSSPIQLNNQKEMREVEEALRYFKSKKLEREQTQEHLVPVSSTKNKTISDLSTLISPSKSMLSHERLPSPDLNYTKNAYSKKYSLRTLLSPSKTISNSLDKRRAWK